MINMARGKGIVTTILLLVIAWSGVYVWARLQDGGSSNNYFHQSVRPWLVKSSAGRYLFNLHQAGDMRSEYLRPGNQIELVINSMGGLDPGEAVGQQLATSMSKFVGLPVTVTTAIEDLPYTEIVAENRLAVLLDERTPGSVHPAKFYVFFISRATARPTLLGLTYRENAAVVFSDAIKSDFKNNAHLQSVFLVSTALHEFGHQLGLDHNDRPGCLMNESAEIGGIGRTNVVTNFCNFEKQQLAEIKARL